MFRIPESVMEARLGYPSVSPQMSSAYLLPAASMSSANSIHLPVSNHENAVRISNHWFGLDTVEGAHSLANNFVDQSETYFRNLAEVTEGARTQALRAKAIYENAGGKVTDEVLLSIGDLRKTTATNLRRVQYNIPQKTYRVFSGQELDLINKQIALAKTLPPDKSRQALSELARKYAYADLGADVTDQAIRVSRNRARLFRTTNRILLVGQLAPGITDLVIGHEEEDPKKVLSGIKSLSGVGASIVGGEAAAFVGTSLVTGVGLLLGVTPAGWVVIAAGLTFGLVGGFYSGRAAENQVQEILDPKGRFLP